jgi:hypothetical protein
MAIPPPGASGSDRLVAQLEVVSQVAESLTLRLLELEERLEAQKARLASLEAIGSPPSAGGGEERLQATEQRLARVEMLLQRMERPASPPPLRTLPQPALQQESPGRTDAGPPPGQGREGERTRREERRTA